MYALLLILKLIEVSFELIISNFQISSSIKIRYFEEKIMVRILYLRKNYGFCSEEISENILRRPKWGHFEVVPLEHQAIEQIICILRRLRFMRVRQSHQETELQ